MWKLRPFAESTSGCGRFKPVVQADQAHSAGEPSAFETYPAVNPSEFAALQDLGEKDSATWPQMEQTKNA